MKQLKRLIIGGLAFVAVFSVQSCKKKRDCPNGSHENITIKNNSSIAVNWTSEDDPTDSIWMNNGSTIFPAASKGFIEPGNKREIGPDQGECWEYIYSGGVKQYYFIFNNDTVKAIGWDKISGTKRGLLKRVLVDLDYLQKNNFTITYP